MGWVVVEEKKRRKPRIKVIHAPMLQIVSCQVKQYKGERLSFIGKGLYFNNPEYDEPILSGIVTEISPDGMYGLVALMSGGKGWATLDGPFVLIKEVE